jgi:uncharacterized protein
LGPRVIHFEIGCRDINKTSDFYSRLFGWEMTPMGHATMIKTDAGGIGGHLVSLGHEPHNFVTVYVEVDDLQGYLDKAAPLGGKTLVSPVKLPGDQGSFAWMADPEGNLIGLWNPKA